MTINKVFDHFITSRKLADLSKKTISAYIQFVMPFLYFIGLETEFETITQYDISKYLEHVVERDLSRATKATYIRHLKIFLRWAQGTYNAQYNAKEIKIPKSPKRNVRIYSADEIAAIFDTISTESEWLTICNKIIVALMYDSGLRQSEVCGISWNINAFVRTVPKKFF